MFNRAHIKHVVSWFQLGCGLSELNLVSQIWVHFKNIVQNDLITI